MPAWALSDYTIWILSTAVGVVGLYLCMRGLWGDRARGRPTCFKCRYDLSATESLTCPECGHVHRDRRKLFKTRRYFKRFALGLIMLLAALHCHTGAHVQQRRTNLDESWATAVVPTTVWIAMLPSLDDTHFKILQKRLWVDIERDPGVHQVRMGDPPQFKSISGWQADWLMAGVVTTLDHPRYGGARQNKAIEWVRWVCLSRPRAADVARRAMDHQEAGVRSTAAQILGDMKQSDALSISLLAHGLCDADEGVRRACIAALNELGPGAEPALEALLLVAGNATEDPYLRSGAEEVVGRIGPGAVPRLTRELRSRHSRLRGTALRALAGIGEASAPAIDTILPLMIDEALRDHAISAIRCMNAPGIVRLLALISDQSPLQTSALDALEAVAANNPAAWAAMGQLLAMSQDLRHSAEMRDAMSEVASHIERVNRPLEMLIHPLVESLDLRRARDAVTP